VTRPRRPPRAPGPLPGPGALRRVLDDPPLTDPRRIGQAVFAALARASVGTSPDPGSAASAALEACPGLFGWDVSCSPCGASLRVALSVGRQSFRTWGLALCDLVPGTALVAEVTGS
jgi:hypothetical protein